MDNTQVEMAQNICDLINEEMDEHQDTGLHAVDLLDYLATMGYSLTGTPEVGQDAATAFLSAISAIGINS